jgi:1,4-dihydroxy-2-naphthoate octaprenyltransferase
MFALITVIKLQVLANYANDYGDFEKGTDEGRSDRALASGDITPVEMKRMLKFSIVKAFVAGCLTLVFAFMDAQVDWTMLVLGGLGVLGIVAALKYTMGSRAFGYKGLGDIFVMVFFGYVGVLGVGYLLVHTIEWDWLLPATFSGLMAVAVLNLNNMRDVESDKRSGKNTVVVKMGYEKAKHYHAFLIITAWACLLPYLYGSWIGFTWFVLIALTQTVHLVFVYNSTDPKTLDPELKKVAMGAFVTALFMLMSVAVIIQA